MSNPSACASETPGTPASAPAGLDVAAARDAQACGWECERRGDWAQALRHYEQALRCQPDSCEILLDIGVASARLKRFAAAEAAYWRAIALRPRASAAWSNLGALLAAMRRDADALACCQHALELDPRYDKARFNLSYVLLRQGRLAEGLLCLEARAEGVPGLARQLDAPRWDGLPLDGRALLVVSDAGYGDLIQMARYAALLRARGAGRLVLHAPAALKRLLAEGLVGPGFDHVSGYDEPLPRAGWDVWTLSSSLPHLCGTTLDSLPAPLPYLRADAARVAHWRGLLRPHAAAAGPLVGLAWRGNPRHEADADRSLPGLATLAPLGAIGSVRFVPLQFGVEPAELDSAAGRALRLAPLPAPMGDFHETAALVASLDLVIAVDTSVVHLAGALGRPVWTLLADHLTDWRWFEARSDSPWYPGVMRLFRQRVPGDWAAVIAEVRQALLGLR